jgi:hypothetical protein
MSYVTAAVVYEWNFICLLFFYLLVWRREVDWDHSFEYRFDSLWQANASSEIRHSDYSGSTRRDGLRSDRLGKDRSILGSDIEPIIWAWARCEPVSWTTFVRTSQAVSVGLSFSTYSWVGHTNLRRSQEVRIPLSCPPMRRVSFN